MNKNVLIIVTIITLSLISVVGISVFVISKGRSDRRIYNSENSVDQDLSGLSEEDFADFTYEDLIGETDTTETAPNSELEAVTNSEIDSTMDNLDKQMIGINETTDFGDFSPTELEQ